MLQTVTSGNSTIDLGKLQLSQIDQSNLQLLGLGTNMSECQMPSECPLMKKRNDQINALLFKHMFTSLTLQLTFQAVGNANNFPFKFRLRYRLFNFDEVTSDLLVLDPTTSADS